MKMIFRILLLLLTFKSFDVTANSDQIVESGLQSEEWISLEVSKLGGFVNLPSAPRKWLKYGVVLEEQSLSTFRVDCVELIKAANENQNLPLPKLMKILGSFILPGKTSGLKLDAEIELSESRIENIPQACFDGKPNKYQYRLRKSSKDRYYYESRDGQRTLIFFRNPVEGFQSTQSVDVRPFLNGQLRASAIKYEMFGVPYDKSLVINMRSKIQNIIFDPAFPKKFIPTALKSLKKWNDAIGFEAFSLRYKIAQFDPVECFASRSLCFSWEGSPNLSWSGFGGHCDASFDPASGEVIGGVLSITNPAGAMLEETPHAIKTKFIEGRLDRKSVADIYLNRLAMQKYSHPDQESFVGSILLHELGHFIGLAHNFAGSNDWKPGGRANSAMDYLPFPAINVQSNQIQIWDRWALRSRNLNIPLPKAYKFCSDSVGDQITLSLQGQFEDPNCKKMDLGNPVEWAMALATAAPRGLLDRDDSLELMGGREFPMLRHLGIFFFDGEQGRPGFSEARDFVCQQNSNEISEKFLEIFKQKLDCQN